MGGTSIPIAFRQEKSIEAEASPTARFRGRDFSTHEPSPPSSLGGRSHAACEPLARARLSARTLAFGPGVAWRETSLATGWVRGQGRGSAQDGGVRAEAPILHGFDDRIGTRPLRAARPASPLTPTLSPDGEAVGGEGARASSTRAPRNPAALADVLRHPGVWRRSAPTTNVDAQPTGFVGLDALLPGGGWPRGALSEILVDADGIGEFALLAPALAALTRAGQRVVLIAPPYIPYAPALVAAGIDLGRLVHIDAQALDRHWSAEQCLRAGCCAAVLNWLPSADYRQLRRLQLAAETGAALGFVFRPAAAASQASPAALRVRVRGGDAGPAIEIVKCRGNLAGQPGFRTTSFLLPACGADSFSLLPASGEKVPKADEGPAPEAPGRGLPAARSHA